MRIRRFLPVLALLAVLSMAGCSSAPPPVPEKVQSYYDANKSLAPAVTQEAAPVVAFLGDSYTQGTGASTTDSRWTTVLSVSEGWQEKNFGYGGTNYGTPGSLEGGTPYAARVPEITAVTPDVVILSGGGNSLGSDQSAGIDETFNGIRAALPEAQIIALSPFWKAEPFPSELDTVASQIRAAVESVGGQYVELSNPLQGKPELLAPDGVHPNDGGHKVIAEAVEASLAK